MNNLVSDTDKPYCFAWLSKPKCNALVYKNCGSCSFYKHYSDVKGYEKYLPKEKFILELNRK